MEQAPPKILVAPAARGSAWEDVADLSAAFGLVLDPWQEQVLQAAMSERRDGKWAAQRVGLSVPRQNGKSALVVARALAGALLFGERLIVISAHQADTYRESTWTDLNNLIESSPALSKRIKPHGIMAAINREAVTFNNGSRIKFKARTGTGGRGFSADCLMLDEAQIIPAQTWATIYSTMSARENPQIWLTGTPPTPEDDPFAFLAQRQVATSGKSTGLAWIEWGAEPGDDPALESTRRKANPAWDTRINHEVVQGEFETYPSERFALERLGIWAQDTDSLGAIPLPDWNACEAELDALVSPVTLAVETAQDRSVSVLLAVGPRASDGITQLEIVKAAPGDSERAPAPGTAWVPARIAQVVAGNPDVTDVVIDGRAAAAPLLPKIREALDEVETRTGRHVEVTVTTTADVAEACPQLYDAIVQHRIRHSGGEVMAAAVKAATWKDLESGGRIWSRKAMGPDAPVLLAMTLGLWKASHVETYDPMANIW